MAGSPLKGLEVTAFLSRIKLIYRLYGSSFLFIQLKRLTFTNNANMEFFPQ